MFKFHKKNNIYLIIGSNTMEVRHLEKNITVKRKALVPFSTKNSIIANMTNATELLLNIFEKIDGKSFFKPSKKILIQPLINNNEELTQVETVALKDLAQYCGGYKVKVTDLKHHLSDNEVYQVLNDI